MNYFIVSEGKQQGPYTVAELQARHITSDTLVWNALIDGWVPAWQVEELKPIVGEGSGTTEPPQVPPEIPTASTTGGNQGNPAPPEKSRKGVKVLLGVVILLLVVVVMAVTNPDRRDHSQAISREVAGALTSVADSSGLADDPIAQGFLEIGKAFASNIVDAAVDNLLRYNNYVVFSVGQIDYKGESHNVSFGMFGHVWTLDKEDMVKAVENNGQIEVKRIINDKIDKGASTVSGAVSNMLNSAADEASKQADQAVKDLALGLKGEVDKEVDRQLNQVPDSTERSTITRIVDDIKDILGL